MRKRQPNIKYGMLTRTNVPVHAYVRNIGIDRQTQIREAAHRYFREFLGVGTQQMTINDLPEDDPKKKFWALFASYMEKYDPGESFEINFDSAVLQQLGLSLLSSIDPVRRDWGNRMRDELTAILYDYLMALRFNVSLRNIMAGENRTGE